jgi:hypothetical protein
MRRSAVPELFLGLLSIGAAVFGASLVVAHTADKRGTHGDASLTVKWSLVLPPAFGRASERGSA